MSRQNFVEWIDFLLAKLDTLNGQKGTVNIPDLSIPVTVIIEKGEVR
jgi:hypothetical protein